VTGRDDPLGKRALFSPAPLSPAPSSPAPSSPAQWRGASPSDADAGDASLAGSGRRAMFSGPGSASALGSASAPGPSAAQSGLFRLECRSCGAITMLGVTSLVRALVPSVWVPLLPWSRVLRCPACGRWTRARLSWSPRPAATPGP
jgi:hypothetical protein